MRQTTALLLALLFCYNGFAQTTARIPNLKDGFGSTYTYIGEVKGGVPNGVGVALYPSDNTALYYAGYFVNGQYSGKGCIVFTDGIFLSGDWKAGKLNGKGATLNKDGGLYVGPYIDGKKSGYGNFFFKDNSFLTGNYVADDYNGRCIFITANGSTLADNIYRDGKKHGTGYQYEVANKTMFEGTWQRGDWQSAGTATYASFVKSPKFYGEKTANQVIMGCVNKADKNLLTDTAFYYDLRTKKRFFGSYEAGFLKSGLIIKDDSTRFLGTLSNSGAQGPGSFMKVGRFYDEGNYVDDYLTGPNCMSVNMVNKTFYYGGMVKGVSTGKAIFVDKNKDLYVGDYVGGKFTGAGWRIKKDGSFIKGTWKDGLPLTVTALSKNNKTVNLTPKSLAEAISILEDFSQNHFDELVGVSIPFSDSDLADSEEMIEDVNAGILTIPGTTKNYSVTSLLSEGYLGLCLQTTDLKKATARYKDLCKAVQDASITLRKGGSPIKLTGRMEEVPSGSANVVSRFMVPGEEDTDDFSFNVILQQVGTNDYRVYIGAANGTMLTGWITGE